MALFGDDQGKTEQPTPTRLTDVRNRGDTPLSRELVQGGVLMVAAIFVAAAPGKVYQRFVSIFDLKDPTNRDRVAMMHEG